MKVAAKNKAQFSARKWGWLFVQLNDDGTRIYRKEIGDGRTTGTLWLRIPSGNRGVKIYGIAAVAIDIHLSRRDWIHFGAAWEREILDMLYRNSKRFLPS